MTTESPKKKKVLIVITKSNFGGAQRYVYDIARSLTAKCDIAVACGGEGLLVQKLQAENIRIISIPYLGRDVNPLKDVLVFFRLYALFRKEKPDVLHLNSSKIGGMGSLAGRLAKIPHIVFTAHGWAWNEDRGMISKLFIRLIYTLTFAFSNEIIAVSEAIRSQAKNLPFAKKIKVIYLGIDNALVYDRTIARKMLPNGLNDYEMLVGTVAELHPIKGLSYAIEAFSTLRDLNIKYIIWAEGDERKKLEALITKLELKDRVFLPGNVPNASLFMRAFDCLLVPSLSEALGYVVLEAGRAEVPVIATSVGGIPEIIEDMKSGILVHPKNAKDIARAITFMAQNKDKNAIMARALKETISNKFSLSSMIESTAKIYRI
jgi:glycosyltransferase involved in cell wall biosynthesis